MTRRTITGCDAVHPDRRGGQHAGVCTGVMAKCRHMLKTLIRRDDDVAVAIRCSVCGVWLPFAPADDTPEALVELRAAELAHDWRTSPAQNPWLLFRGRETGGWMTHGCASLHDDVTDEQAPGYLARAIVMHDEEAQGKPAPSSEGSK